MEQRGNKTVEQYVNCTPGRDFYFMFKYFEYIELNFEIVLLILVTK